MSSFFEKLKKGMRIENMQEEPEKKEEKLKQRSLKSPAKKKMMAPKAIYQAKPAVKKVKIEPDLIKPEVKQPEKEEIKKPKELEPEEKKEEAEAETKKPFFQKIMQKEEKPESDNRGFNLQNLGGEEGQLAIDVYQTDTELVIQSTIAGIKSEELDISIEADTVLIKGNRQEPTEPEEKNYFYQECYWGPFSRQIILPEETDPSRAEASMKEGVLTIRIPKIERKKKRKIAVKA